MVTEKITLAQLESFLFKAADILRGKMDTSGSRNSFLAAAGLNRYPNAEKRGLIAVIENLWDKCAVSSRELEKQRAETLDKLNGFLKGLGYLEVQT